MPPNATAGPSKRGQATPNRPAKRSRRNERSVWNSTDDWDELVQASTLSTSSISARRPRPYGLVSLKQASVQAAVRSFKRIFETHESWWIAEWRNLPDAHKAAVRDGIFRMWGSVLSIERIREVSESSTLSVFSSDVELFLVPPELHLPAELLPALAKTQSLKPFHPSDAGSFTSLRLTHASAVSDIAIAGLIHQLPNLETLVLKGCTKAGARTVKTILERCPKLRRLNLKGANVSEGDVKALLNAYGSQIQAFKVDNVVFEVSLTSKRYAHSSIPRTRSCPAPYPCLTHLCLPGDVINRPRSGDMRQRARAFAQSIAYPTPRVVTKHYELSLGQL